MRPAGVMYPMVIPIFPGMIPVGPVAPRPPAPAPAGGNNAAADGLDLSKLTAGGHADI